MKKNISKSDRFYESIRKSNYRDGPTTFHMHHKLGKGYEIYAKNKLSCCEFRIFAI